jgi:hypothetical protein
LIKKLAAFGIVGAEFDDGFAPQFIHFLGPGWGGKTKGDECQEAGFYEGLRHF